MANPWLTYHFRTKAGTTEALGVVWTHDDGTPVDLTGAAIVYRAETPTPIVKQVGSGIVLTDAVAGTFEIDIDEADTAGLRSMSVAHECKAKTAAGTVAVVFAGVLTVLESLVEEVE